MPTIPCKGRHFQHDMTLQSIRWYLTYSLSYRDIEELMAERGFSIKGVGSLCFIDSKSLCSDEGGVD